MPQIVELKAQTRVSKYAADVRALEEAAELLVQNPDKFIGGLIEEVDTKVKARYAASKARAALLEKGVDTRARIFATATGHTFALKLK